MYISISMIKLFLIILELPFVCAILKLGPFGIVNESPVEHPGSTISYATTRVTSSIGILGSSKNTEIATSAWYIFKEYFVTLFSFAAYLSSFVYFSFQLLILVIHFFKSKPSRQSAIVMKPIHNVAHKKGPRPVTAQVEVYQDALSAV